MKKLAVMLAAALLLVACRTMPEPEAGAPVTEPEATAEYHKITAEEAYAMMAGGTVTIVDVRTEQEYAEGHIADAVLVPNETIGGEAPEELPDMDATLLVYCRSGRRSKEASEKLLSLGYRNVYDFGGINDWPYDIVTE